MAEPNLDDVAYEPKTKRGMALIFNVTEFSGEKLKDQNMRNRWFSDGDARAIMRQLSALGFDHKLKQNLTKAAMEREIQAASEADHSDDFCFMFVLMTHGQAAEGAGHRPDAVYATDGTISINRDIVQPFIDCPTLRAKPKIFILQTDLPVPAACDGPAPDGPEDDRRSGYVGTEPFPSGADVIAIQSTIPGEEFGEAWVIRKFSQVLNDHHEDLDLNGMFTKTLSLVGEEIDRRNRESLPMPEWRSELRGSVSFASPNP